MTHFMLAQSFSTDTTTPAPVPVFSPFDGIYPGLIFLMVVLVLAIIGVALLLIEDEYKAAWQWKVGATLLGAAGVFAWLTREAIMEAAFSMLVSAIVFGLIILPFINPNRR